MLLGVQHGPGTMTWPADLVYKCFECPPDVCIELLQCCFIVAEGLCDCGCVELCPNDELLHGVGSGAAAGPCSLLAGHQAACSCCSHAVGAAAALALLLSGALCMPFQEYICSTVSLSKDKEAAAVSFNPPDRQQQKNSLAQ